MAFYRKRESFCFAEIRNRTMRSVVLGSIHLYTLAADGSLPEMHSFESEMRRRTQGFGLPWELFTITPQFPIVQIGANQRWTMGIVYLCGDSWK